MVERDQERGAEEPGRLSGKPLWSRLSSPGNEQRGKSVVLELELVVLQVSEDLSHPNLAFIIFPAKGVAVVNISL